MSESLPLFHEYVDLHGWLEIYISLPEFDVAGQRLSFGRLKSGQSSNIGHDLANGSAPPVCGAVSAGTESQPKFNNPDF